MSDPGEFGRRLKLLRARDQVTMTRLATTTTMDKDRLKELEAGKAAPTPWERQRIAEAFNVGPEYFSAAAVPAAGGSAKGAPGGGRAGAKRSGQALDFSEFKYFKDGDGHPSVYDSGDADASGGTVHIADGAALATDLFDDSDSVEREGERAAGEAPKGDGQAEGRAGGARGDKAGGVKAAASAHGKGDGDYVDPFASFRAPGTPAPTVAAGGRSMAPADAVEPVSERRRGGRSARQKKPAAPLPAPDPSMTMGKAPGARFAHSPGVTDELVGAAPSGEPPSRGFAATLRDAPPPPPPPPPPGSLPMRRSAPREAPRPPERTLTAEAEALLDATFGVAPAIPPARHAPVTARYAPLPPEALARAAQEREAAVTGAIDPKQAALEALVYVKALTEVLLARGLLTGEELAKALRRARGE